METEKTAKRGEEIVKEFLIIADKHVEELLAMRASKRFSSSDFAGLLFINPRHFTNTVKEVTGKSPCDIMEERLTAEAKKFLDSTSFSVAEIGYRLGYKDPTNFIKFFKGMVGLTPLQYKKSFGIDLKY